MEQEDAEFRRGLVEAAYGAYHDFHRNTGRRPTRFILHPTDFEAMGGYVTRVSHNTGIVFLKIFDIPVTYNIDCCRGHVFVDRRHLDDPFTMCAFGKFDLPAPRGDGVSL